MQAVPSSRRPCNRFPCPNEVTVWDVGPWSSCTPLVLTPSSPTDCTLVGKQTRNVTCKQVSSGAVRPRADCTVTSPWPGDEAPCSLQDVALSQGCVCQVPSDCSSPVGHWTCDVASHTCACDDGWVGDACDVPLLYQGGSGARACVTGVVDVVGECCEGYVDMSTGVCCMHGVLDGRGVCCASPLAVDACGVCGGDGVAVDALGACCASALPPSGVCCISGTVDSCGVCDGSNACTYVAPTPRVA